MKKLSKNFLVGLGLALFGLLMLLGCWLCYSFWICLFFSTSVPFVSIGLLYSLATSGIFVLDIYDSLVLDEIKMPNDKRIKWIKTELRIVTIGLIFMILFPILYKYIPAVKTICVVLEYLLLSW